MPLAVTGAGGGPCHLNGLAPARGRGRADQVCLGHDLDAPDPGEGAEPDPRRPRTSVCEYSVLDHGKGPGLVSAQEERALRVTAIRRVGAIVY